MIKKIKLGGDPLQVKCKLLIDSCFNGCSEIELKIMTVLVRYGTGNSITLTPDLARQIRESAVVSEGSFSTYLFRLEKKKVFIRQGKTIMLHPVFNNIGDCDSIMISFKSELSAPVKS